MLKCNIHAAILTPTGKVGFGCIICNSNVEMIGAKNGTLPAPLDHLLAEALSWIKDLGLRDKYVESNAFFLITAMCGSSHDSSYFGLIVKDWKELASEL